MKREIEKYSVFQKRNQRKSWCLVGFPRAWAWRRRKSSPLKRSGARNVKWKRKIGSLCSPTTTMMKILTKSNKTSWETVEMSFPNLTPNRKLWSSTFWGSLLTHPVVMKSFQTLITLILFCTCSKNRELKLSRTNQRIYRPQNL